MAQFSFAENVEKKRSVFNSGRTKSIEWRKRQLEAIIRMTDEKEDEMCDAMKKDLNKSRMESMGMEVGFSRNECVHILNNLDEWAGPQPVKKNMLAMMDTCFIKPEPLGTVLIMGAWNYPIQLTLVPLIGAIAAGNCAVLKPSEISENTAQLLGRIIPQYLDPDCVAVVNGGIPETTALLKERFDYIFYTGNSMVGKIVMEAASKNLTPVTLELGGKSPCYIDKSSNLDVVAQRVIWGKFANFGQTCIAPDYVICHSQIKDQLLSKFKSAVVKFWGEDPQKSPDLGRMVNSRHFQRVKKFLDNGDIFVGGQTDEKDKYIAPTILHNVKITDPVMQEEIFGPVLPVITIDNLSEVVEFVNSREKPLAMYIFSKDDQQVETLIENVSSGGTCVNDALMHVTLDTLPFGGVGNSGTGAYHGKFTFDTFCHKKSVMIKKQAMEAVNNLRYPPYTERKFGILQFLMQKKRKRTGMMSYLPMVMLGVLLAVVFKMLGLQTYLPRSLKD